ncbi:MAG: hypothetical protein GY865_05870 [candidate division Zixibacteria bacterium]|nr:hypothetical protein [candidate division Zixibacteria bacterium]
MYRKIGLFSFFIIFLFCPQLLFSAIVNVPAEQPTIQDAIDSLVAYGDTIIVAPGTYIENISTKGKTLVLLSQGGPEVTRLVPMDHNLPTLRLDTSSEPIILQGFTFEDATFRGGALSVCNSADISYNIFFDNQMGITVHCANPNIHHNLFIQNTYLGGIVLFNAAQIYNNTFDYNDVSINFADGINGIANIRNNIFSNSWANIIGDIFYTSPNIDYNNFWNYWGSIEPYGFPIGPHDISEDPQFVDSGNNDYNLQINSPCVDAGYPGEFDSDGSIVDMGAFPRLFVMPYAKQINYGEPHDYLVSTLTPSFFWTYFDVLPSTQQQYQIQVGTDEDWSVAEMWDSGPVTSSSTESIYDGLPLTDYTKYYLRIRLNDGTNWGEWIPDWFITHSKTHTFKVPSEMPTIQEGIDYALDGDTVLVAPGIYFANMDFLGKTIVVTSEKGAKKTFVRPSNINEPTVRIDNGEGEGTVLSGFTIRNGDTLSTVVMIGHASEAVIENNVFRNNISKVINPLTVIKVENRASIRYNLFFDNGGINTIWSDGNAEIINNTIDSNERGVYSTSSLTVLRNNIITNNAEYGTLGSFGEFDYNNVWNNGSGNDIGPNGISSDPLFVDLTWHNYNIRLASPCVDAGDPDPIYNDLNGTRNDIGAFPFYYCGDADLNNEVTVGDIVYLINYYFAGGPHPVMLFNSDVNCDDIISLVDLILMNRHVLSNGSVNCCY